MRKHMYFCAGVLAVWFLLHVAAASRAADAQQAPTAKPWLKVTVERFAENPIISPATPGWAKAKDAQNINGPCLIRVPEWVAKPLGRYYLYFAHHGGKYIRLAYADRLAGPWKIHTPGVLRLEDTAARGHIASPDVLLDPQRREFRLYFHGPGPGGQVSFVALGSDGLSFKARPEVLAPFYLRVVRYQDQYLGIAKRGNSSMQLLRSPDGLKPFEQGPYIFPRGRHAALRLEGDRLRVFFTRAGDAPESILLTQFNLKADWKDWETQAPPPLVILKPQQDYEGIAYPNKPSSYGSAVRVCQLRDPAIYEEQGRMYLVYSVAGEMGLAMAEVKLAAAEEK